MHAMDAANAWTGSRSGVRLMAGAGALALALITAGCGAAAGSGAGGPAGEIALQANEFAYSPATLRLPAAGQVTVTLQNQGALEHDFTIEGAQGKLFVKPKATGKATFKIPKAGTYTYTCTIEGHRAAGMHGTLTVG